MLIGFATNIFAADKLRISYSAVNATQAFLWVAQEKGFFAKHGLEGELLYINSGTMNIAALVGGSVQVAGGGPVSIEGSASRRQTLDPRQSPALVSLQPRRQPGYQKLSPSSLENSPASRASARPPIKAFAICFARTG